MVKEQRGKEDMSKIDHNDMLNIMKSGFNAPVMLTELVHFNPKYPQYRNIYKSNMRSKYAYKYNGTSWDLTDEKNLIETIYDSKKNYIEDNMDEFKNLISTSQYKSLNRWLSIDDDNDKKIIGILDEIRLMLYNRREMAMHSK